MTFLYSETADKTIIRYTIESRFRKFVIDIITIIGHVQGSSLSIINIFYYRRLQT